MHTNIILDGTHQNAYAKLMTLDDFLTALINEKYKGATLEDYQKADIRKDLTGRLNKFISLNVLTELATRDQSLLVKFQSLANDDTKPEAIKAFVENEIPDGAAFLTKVLTDFRALYLG